MTRRGRLARALNPGPRPGVTPRYAGLYGHLTNDEMQVLVWIPERRCPWGCPLDPPALAVDDYAPRFTDLVHHPKAGIWRTLWRLMWTRKTSTRPI